MALSKTEFVILTATMPNNDTLTDAVDVGSLQLDALVVPATVAAALTFQVSHDGALFQDLYQADGTEVSIQSSTHERSYPVPAELRGWPYCKIRSGTGASPVTQTDFDSSGGPGEFYFVARPTP